MGYIALWIIIRLYSYNFYNGKFDIAVKSD